MVRQAPIKDSGFSLPEVMVSTLLLTLVVANSAKLYIRSNGNVSNSSLRDGIYARIAEDVEMLRQRSWNWACEVNSGCDGNLDQQVLYKTGRLIVDPNFVVSSANVAPNLPNPYVTACGRSVVNPTSAVDDAYISSTSTSAPRLASVMMSELPQELPPGPTLLAWNTGATLASQLPPALSKIKVSRTITASGNELQLQYATDATSPVKVQMSTTLVPQAAGWCP